MKADDPLAFLEDVDHASVGLNPDLGNLVRLHREIEPVTDMFEKVLPHANFWHAKNYSRTEDATTGLEGARYSCTPTLGVFHAMTGSHGDLMIPEDRLKAAVVKAALGETTLEVEVDKLLGKPWDDELETFRHAGDGAPVRWLHQVV